MLLKAMFFHVLLIFGFSVAWAQPVAVDDLAVPEGEVILIISGAIGTVNVAGEAHFDRAMLESIGMEEVQTTTPWTDGAQRFEGVPLYQLLARVKAEGSTLRLTALNDYRVDLPMPEALVPGPLLSLGINGMALSARDKGPIWLIYPYDSHESFQTDVIYAQSVWQLSRIEVLP